MIFGFLLSIIFIVCMFFLVIHFHASFIEWIAFGTLGWFNLLIFLDLCISFCLLFGVSLCYNAFRVTSSPIFNAIITLLPLTFNSGIFLSLILIFLFLLLFSLILFYLISTLFDYSFTSPYLCTSLLIASILSFYSF